MSRVLMVSTAVIAGCMVLAVPSPRPLLPRDGQGLAVAPVVKDQMIRMMSRGIRDQVEPAACVSSWRVEPDSAHRKNVDVYALTLAETDSADAMNIWWHRRICGDTAPSVHGHVSRRMTVPYPSQMDSLSAAERHAPFSLLLFRLDDSTFGVRLYGMRP